MRQSAKLNALNLFATIAAYLLSMLPTTYAILNAQMGTGKIGRKIYAHVKLYETAKKKLISFRMPLVLQNMRSSNK